jgi:hypothetical protein
MSFRSDQSFSAPPLQLEQHPAKHARPSLPKVIAKLMLVPAPDQNTAAVANAYFAELTSTCLKNDTKHATLADCTVRKANSQIFTDKPGTHCLLIK